MTNTAPMRNIHVSDFQNGDSAAVYGFGVRDAGQLYRIAPQTHSSTTRYINCFRLLCSALCQAGFLCPRGVIPIENMRDNPYSNKAPASAAQMLSRDYAPRAMSCWYKLAIWTFRHVNECS